MAKEMLVLTQLQGEGLEITHVDRPEGADDEAYFGYAEQTARDFDAWLGQIGVEGSSSVMALRAHFPSENADIPVVDTIDYKMAA